MKNQINTGERIHRKTRGKNMGLIYDYIGIGDMVFFPIEKAKTKIRLFKKYNKNAGRKLWTYKIDRPAGGVYIIRLSH